MPNPADLFIVSHIDMGQSRFPQPFDAFSPRYDQDVESCLEALEDFNTAYQASVAEPTPLFRRR